MIYVKILLQHVHVCNPLITEKNVIDDENVESTTCVHHWNTQQSTHVNMC